MRNKNFILLILVLLFTGLEIYSQQVDFSNGVKQLEDQQYQKAKSIFYSLTLKDPTDCKAIFYLGQTYFKQKIYDSAEFYFKKIQSVNPEDPYAFLGNGKIALRANEAETSMEMFKQARKSSKNDLNILLLIVDAYLNNPKAELKLAESVLLEIDKKYPQNPGYFMAKAEVDIMKEEFGKAANDYEWAYLYDPQNSLAYRRLGHIYLGTLLYRESLAALNKSIEIDPDQVMAYKYLGDLQYRFGKYAEAKKAYQKYMSVAETSIENKEKYALILFYNKEFNAAAEEMKKVIQQDPANPYMNRIIAYVAYETGDFENGMKYITKFFQLHDTTKLLATDYLYYGKLLLKTGSDSAGIVNIKKALKIDGDRTDAYNDLAAALSKYKKHDDAIAIYEKLISKGFDKASTYFRIGKEYYYKGQAYKDIYDSTMRLVKTSPEKNISDFSDSIFAMESFAKADSFFSLVALITPEFYGSYLWKGRVLSLIDSNMEKGLAKDPYEKALSFLEKENISQNLSSIIECYKYLGAYYYFKSESAAEADKNLSASLKMISIGYYEKIVSLDPNNLQAKDILNELNKVEKKGIVQKKP